MYVIYLALSTTLPSSVAFFLGRTSEVTMPQDRHIFQNGLFSSILPVLYIHESDGDSFGDAMGKSDAILHLLPALSMPPLYYKVQVELEVV